MKKTLWKATWVSWPRTSRRGPCRARFADDAMAALSAPALAALGAPAIFSQQKISLVHLLRILTRKGSVISPFSGTDLFEQERTRRTTVSTMVCNLFVAYRLNPFKEKPFHTQRTCHSSNQACWKAGPFFQWKKSWSNKKFQSPFPHSFQPSFRIPLIHYDSFCSGYH